MAKLNQIIAVEKGTKSKTHSAVSDWYKVIQKADLFNGFSRTYKKKDDAGEDFPPEKRKVQVSAKDVLANVRQLLSVGMDVMACKDWTNCVAKSDVVVGGAVVIKDAPVTFLLSLEKQLVDFRTMVVSLPILSEDDDWDKDINSGLYKTQGTLTHRTKKEAKAIVLYPATQEHPAQTQLVSEDVIVGYWETIKQSGAMPKPEKEALISKIETLLNAVKSAREAANGVEVVAPPQVGQAVFDFIFG